MNEVTQVLTSGYSEKQRVDHMVEDFLTDVSLEVVHAMEMHPPMHSLHEAYAVILEEVDEFKAHVWEKQSERSPLKVYSELVHIAAMVTRCVVDCMPDEFKK